MRQMVGKKGNKRGHADNTHRTAQPFHAAGRKEGVSKGNKSYLPSKPCASCGRPFSWRKKWERCWDEVKYCSDRCRRNKPPQKNQKDTADV